MAFDVPTLQQGEPFFWGVISPGSEHVLSALILASSVGEGLQAQAQSVCGLSLGTFGENSIRSARPVPVLPRRCVTGLLGQCPLQGVLCSLILAVGVPQGMSLQWGQFASPKSERAVKSALWLFPCSTACSERRCPAPPSPHGRVSQRMLSLLSCYSAAAARLRHQVAPALLQDSIPAV